MCNFNQNHALMLTANGMNDVEKDQEEPVGEAFITLPVHIAKLMSST